MRILKTPLVVLLAHFFVWCQGQSAGRYYFRMFNKRLEGIEAHTSKEGLVESVLMCQFVIYRNCVSDEERFVLVLEGHSTPGMTLLRPNGTECAPEPPLPAAPLPYG